MSPTTNPIFSIIIPAFNVELYVGKCLRSVAQQTLQDIEVIIVDDQSSDATLGICQAFCASRPNFFVYSKKNEGQGVARNFGLERAKGEFVCFVDSDDWIEPNLCADMLDVFNSTTPDFVNFGFDFVGNTGTSVKRFKTFRVSELSGPDIFRHAMLDDQILSPPWNKVYRRAMLINNNIKFPPIRINEDLFFSRAVSKASSKTIFVSKTYYHALIRPTSTSRSMGINSFLDTERLFALERETFIPYKYAAASHHLFNAHVVKTLSYLLIQAAFRLNSVKDFLSCFSIANRIGFSKLVLDGNVLALLRRKNIFMLHACRHPLVLYYTAKLLSILKIAPY